MLSIFRENARSWLIQLVFFAIAVVFILSFGAGSRGLRTSLTTSTPWAAKVKLPGSNEEGVVPANTFLELYNTQVWRMQQYGMTPDQMKNLKIREQVMDEVVDEELLAQAAALSGLSISDEDLAKAIRKGGRFNDPETNKFDPERYREYIKGVESAKSFETRIRRALLSSRESALAVAAVPVSDDELKQELLKRDEAASIAFVKFLPGNFRDQVQTTPADVDAELKDHLADVQKHFDETKTLYTDPPAMKARRLFVPVKQDATPDEENAAKKKIEDAKAALAAGKKWEDLVPQFSGDPSPGGELGWVKLGDPVPSRLTNEAIFKLSPGETSDVVRDKVGYEIVQALEKREKKEKPFDDVKRDIATDLVRENKADELAKAAAQKTLDQLKAGQALEAQWPKQEKPAKDAPPISPAEAKKPHTVVTEEFHPTGGMVPSAGSVPKVSEAAFSLSADKRFPDAVIQDQKSYWVIELRSRTRADLSKVVTQKDSLMEEVQRDKRNDARKAWLKHLADISKIEKNQDFLSYERKARPGEQLPDDS
jgi:peptidyl-prolyl cis-trans isomerase D